MKILRRGYRFLAGRIEKRALSLKPVLYSILAESYQEYYENNMWKVADRLPTDNIDKVILPPGYTNLSLSCEILLFTFPRKYGQPEKTKLASMMPYFRAIWIPGNSDPLYMISWPSRIAFFSNEQSNLPEAETKFELDNVACLKPHPEFLQYTFTCNDSCP